MSFWRQRYRMGFQAKVLAPVLAILVLLLGGTLWLVHRHIHEEFRITTAKNLAAADAVLKNSREIRSKNLLLRFRSVPNEPRFKAVSQLGDPFTLRALFTELLEELGADAAMFTTQDGRVLAAVSRHPNFKQEEFESASAAAIQRAGSNGQPSADLIPVNGRLFDVVSLPSSVSGHLVGVLTFGVELGESVVHEFKQLTRSEIVLLSGDRVTVSTLIATLPPNSHWGVSAGNRAGASGPERDSIREILLGGEHFLATSGRLDTLDAGRNLGYVLLSSYEHKLQVLHATERRIGLFGLAGIVSSAGILWGVIRGITRPLRQLRDAAEKIGSGDFSRRVPVASRDECGELAKVFNQMTGKLGDSRAQLEQAHGELERRVHDRTAALAASEERFRAVAENLGDGLLLTDLDDNILDVNPRLLQMTGYAREEVIGQRGYELLNSPEQVEEIKTHNAARAEGRSGHYQISLRRKDGSRFWVEITGAPVRDPRGNIFGTVGVVRDITGRKQAEARLEAIHQQLLETSRQAGMAEIATGVLHNVGNVLNSVNVSATLVQDRLKQSKFESLARTISLIGEHAGDLAAFLTADPQGRRVPGFLAKLSGHLTAERAQVLEEMAVVARNIEHIKQIVAMQQTYATASGVIESLPPAQLVEDALSMSGASLARDNIEIIREFGEVPAVVVDKHKALQILVNLIRNARQALVLEPDGEKRLCLRVEMSGAGRVRIVVQDTGAGIPPENLARIFQHGFTTKKDGHGFGLHSGANAAKEMGGSLCVTSAGPGCGAAFTLELPASVASQTREAA